MAQINRRKFAVSLTASLMLAAPAVSLAQFGGLLNKAGLGGGGTDSNAGADLGAHQEKLVRSYVAAGKDVRVANGHLSDALGIQAQQIDLNATSDSLSASDIEAQDKAISAQAAAVSEALKSGAKLKDEQAKATYTKGLLALAVGLKKYMDMRKDAQGFASGLTSASPLMIAKLQSGAYVAQRLPVSVTNLSTVLQSAVEFATSNGIQVPKDATSVL